MRKEFREFSKNPWLEKVDCMVLAVLSHGKKDVICGIDGEGIDVLQEIVPIFSSKECPSLAGKPKMYICNACRGGKFLISYLVLQLPFVCSLDQFTKGSKINLVQE